MKRTRRKKKFDGLLGMSTTTTWVVGGLLAYQVWRNIKDNLLGSAGTLIFIPGSDCAYSFTWGWVNVKSGLGMVETCDGRVLKS